MKKLIFYILLLSWLLPYCLYGQKTVNLRHSQSANAKGNRVIRAVIVGVRTYPAMKKLDQLEYSDKDAIDFKNFLLKNGVKSDSNHLKVFLNERAYNPNDILDYLDRFISFSDKDDLVIFYFSGHGDVQQVENSLKGYLLLSRVRDPSVSTYSRSNVISVDELKSIAETSGGGEKQLLLIIDACRKNKVIAGNTKKTAVNISTALSREWPTKMIYRLMSCKEGQQSAESDDHQNGLFTYYLLNGLSGAADRDVNGVKDGSIQFRELELFLEDSFLPIQKDQYPELYASDNLYKLFDATNPALQQTHASIQTLRTKVKGINGPGVVPVELAVLHDQFVKCLDESTLIRPKHTALKDSATFKVGNITRHSAHRKVCNDVSFHPDGSEFVSASDDGFVRRWDRDKRKLKKDYHIPGGALVAKYSPDGEKLIVGAWPQNLYCVDLLKDSLYEIKEAHTNDVRAIAFSTDSKLLATSGNDNTIRIWRVTSHVEPQTHKPMHHMATVIGLAFVNNNKQLVSLDEHGAILWDCQSFRKLSSVQFDTDVVKNIWMEPSGNILYLLTEKGRILEMEGKGLRLLRTYPSKGPATSFALNSEGKFAFFGNEKSSNNLLASCLIDIDFVSQVPLSHRIKTIAIDPHNSLVVAGMQNGDITMVGVTVPARRKYASEILDRMSSYSSFAPIRRNYVSTLVAALEFSNAQLIEDFITGSELLPSVPEIREAIRRHEQALKLTETNEWKKGRIRSNLLLLQVIEIVVSNNFTRLRDAKAKVDEIIKSDPYEAYTFNTLSVIHRRLNDMANAESSAKNASDKLPGWIEPIANLGKVNFLAGRYQQAIEKYSEITKLAPESSRGYEYLGELYTWLGSYRKAAENLTKARKLDSTNVSIINKQAVLEMERGRFDEALQLLKMAAKIDPGYFGTFSNMGRVHEHKFFSDPASVSSMQSANSYYSLALKLNPEDPVVYIKLSQFYIRILELENKDNYLKLLRIDSVKSIGDKKLNASILLKAVAELAEIAKRKLPYEPDVYDVLGYLNHYWTMEKNKTFNAKNPIPHDSYKYAIDNLGTNPRAYANYIHFLIKIGDKKSAVDICNKAIGKHRDYLPLYFQLGSIHAMQGNLKAGLKIIEDAKASIQFKETPLLEYELALLSLRYNDKGSAKRYAQNALSFDADFAFALEISTGSERISKF
jgi:WD40 repeat protein/tetratricopeptide (TPR) repeat protein